MITLWDIIFVNKKLSLVLAITVIVILVAISGGAMRELQRAQLHQKLVAHGMLAAATIVDKDKYTEKSKDGSYTVHRIRYEFKTGNSITNRTRKANRNVWESKRIGEKFTVRYLPENPESHVAEWENLEPDIRLDSFLMGGIFGLVLYVIGYFAYRRLCTIKRILNYGIFDRATVTREIVHSGKKRRSYSYEYAFETIDGQKQVGTADGFKKPEYRTGDSLDILYLKNDPEKNMHLTPLYRALWTQKTSIGSRFMREQ